MIDHRAEPSKKSGVNYEQLGKAVEDALILDYIYVLHSTKRQVFSSFVRGFFAGLGGFVGATLGAAVLVAMLKLLGGSPVVGEFFRALGETLKSGGR